MGFSLCIFHTSHLSGAGSGGGVGGFHACQVQQSNRTRWFQKAKTPWWYTGKSGKKRAPECSAARQTGSKLKSSFDEICTSSSKTKCKQQKTGTESSNGAKNWTNTSRPGRSKISQKKVGLPSGWKNAGLHCWKGITADDKNRDDWSRKVQFMCSCFTDFFPHSSISSDVLPGSYNDGQNYRLLCVSTSKVKT